MLGMEELSADDQRGRAARPPAGAVPHPADVRDGIVHRTSRAGTCPLADTIAGCEAILDGKFDAVEESKLYMIGAVAEVKP